MFKSSILRIIHWNAPILTEMQTFTLKNDNDIETDGNIDSRETYKVDLVFLII